MEYLVDRILGNGEYCMIHCSTCTQLAPTNGAREFFGEFANDESAYLAITKKFSKAEYCNACMADLNNN